MATDESSGGVDRQYKSRAGVDDFVEVVVGFGGQTAQFNLRSIRLTCLFGKKYRSEPGEKGY